MPRYPSQSPLPPLKKALPQFKSLRENKSKIDQTADLLRQVITENRTKHNITFYSTRAIAEFFGISQNTATLAVGRLETEGMVRRIRGSHTLMLGTKIIRRSRIRAVAGLLSWEFAQRFSETQCNLNRQLAEVLWPHNIALEIIPHYDLGESRPDLNERLKKHMLDFTIWPFPYNHHKEHLPYLHDRGVRNLVIGVKGVRGAFEPQILIDFPTAYAELLRYWREQHDIHRVLVIQPREFTPRKRIEVFLKMARERGFDCSVEPSDYARPARILECEKDRVGIALLDEHSTVEFTFYDPASFVALLERHRVLYGIGAPNVPFVPNGEFRVERIFTPIINNSRPFEKPLAHSIAEILLRWCSGDFSSEPNIISPRFWENGQLWRYL